MQRSVQETRKPAPGAPTTRGRKQTFPDTDKPQAAASAADSASEVDTDEAIENILSLSLKRIKALGVGELRLKGVVNVDGENYEVSVSPQVAAPTPAQQAAASVLAAAPATPSSVPPSVVQPEPVKDLAAAQKADEEAIAQGGEPLGKPATSSDAPADASAPSPETPAAEPDASPAEPEAPSTEAQAE